MIYVLDTNTLVWRVSGSPRLTQRAKDTIDKAIESDDQLVVPTIVLAEAWDMDRKQRGDFAPFDRVLQVVLEMNMSVMSFDMALIERLRDPALESLRSVYSLWSDIHDMIIMATALIAGDNTDEEVSIISGDRQIRAQSLIRCVW
jgi:PIN domain nuclease of toxin-antitoxin system